ncbi:MAG: alanine--tRNA ligase, partial [Dehalococcoidales bacterium]|nr:alanine--tRNA ligase [Dehalococcoidales bacterium]
MMTSDEVRSAFLKFFEGKDHKVIPSSSLIPQGDPTLLLTTAGMVQIKPYFLGEAVPPNPRLASCQKCFRMTDIDSVGDTTHCTFFEMLGNFSVGDYFKKEAIAWAWEFVTKELELPPERLRITIYLDDDEAFNIWRGIGIPENMISRMDAKDNFWGPAGNSGPCGPCSEIHYDFGADNGCGKPDCGPGCSCGRFVEIWNLVFTQYNQNKDGKRNPLPRPNIDTGMGLERVASIMQGKRSIYQTDLFVPLLDRIAGISGKKYGVSEETDRAIRVIAEHSRGITFLIGDGVVPGNDGRGYVLRRLLRRTSIFGRRLGLEKPFLSEMAKVVIGKMGKAYPEISKRQDFILKVIEMEEARFQQTLNTGLELIEEILGKNGEKKVISGKDAFKLYDTYGFPAELTEEIATSRGFTVDLDAFEKEMAKQREKARASHKFEWADSAIAGLKDKLKCEATNFVGYDSLKKKASIRALLIDSESAGTLGDGQEGGLVLDNTPFYGEIGGQLGDTGEIIGSSGHFQVTNTVHGPAGIVIHQGKVNEGILTVGEDVEAMVDAERRFDIARNHTATHLLQYALRKVLGEHVQQRGSMVAPDRLRFDFSHLTLLSEKELKEIQYIINAEVRRNHPVYAEELNYRQALDEGATALFGEKYGDTVRVLKIGKPPVSMELCGGTHVSATGEIGYFLIVSESSVGAGLRRIEAITGREAENYIDRQFTELNRIARIVAAPVDEVPGKVTGLVEELEAEKCRTLALERELSKQAVNALLNQVEIIKGVNILAGKVDNARPQMMREMGDMLRDKLKSGV